MYCQIFSNLLSHCPCIVGFRLVDVVQDVVEMLDEDGVTDGADKTLISAVESLLRFFIISLEHLYRRCSWIQINFFDCRTGNLGLALALLLKIQFNFFGALTVLLDKPFKVGDWVDVGNSQGEVVKSILELP